MEARGKRIDLRVGAFACSLQGFDDPLPALTHILHELRALHGAAADGQPLFDAETLSRLEAEIATVAGGGVSAVPGLVLTPDAGAEESPAAVADGSRDARPDADAALEGLAAAIPPASDAAEPAPPEDGSPASAEAAEHDAAAPEDAGATGDPREAAGPGPVAEPDGSSAAPAPLDGAPDAKESAQTSLESDDAAAVPEPPAVTAGDARETRDGADAAAEAGDTFAAESDGHSAPDPSAEPEPGTAEEPLPAPPDGETSAPAARAELEAPAREDGNLFAAGGEPDTEDGERDAANLFAASGGDDDDPGINLFADDAAAWEGAAAARAGDPHEDRRIEPGAYRRLDFVRARPHGRPAEGGLPPRAARRDLSAADLAKRARAKAPAELMAAAAAWLTVVKGHASFTKREVLDLFEALPGDHPRTAEAKVKGFGRLVRNGQIVLGGDERFRMSEAERDRFEDLLG